LKLQKAGSFAEQQQQQQQQRNNQFSMQKNHSFAEGRSGNGTPPLTPKFAPLVRGSTIVGATTSGGSNNGSTNNSSNSLKEAELRAAMANGGTGSGATGPGMVKSGRADSFNPAVIQQQSSTHVAGIDADQQGHFVDRSKRELQIAEVPLVLSLRLCSLLYRIVTSSSDV
jgi:hypothetical protein